jgi:polysaccharide biosynthesis transport protein
LPTTAVAAQGIGNATIQAQIVQIESEIAKYKVEQENLIKTISQYQAKLEAGPVREQEITELMRDYAISKDHYSQLLEKKMSAQMATQLEIRQQGERFTILDPAQVAEKPSKPNRVAIGVAGAGGGLALGLGLALASELFGGAITSGAQITSALGITVLGVIPIIVTPFDQKRRKRLLLASATGGLVMMLTLAVIVVLHFRNQIF